MVLKNKKGEDMYMLVITSSSEFNAPYIRINTWDKLVEDFEKLIVEVDNDKWYVKQIEVTRLPEYHRMEASLLCNHKGWGCNFFKCITIEAVYTF